MSHYRDCEEIEMKEKTYSKIIILDFADRIEGLLIQNESLQRQIDKVDFTLIGTTYNWQGSDKSRIEMLEAMVKASGFRK